MADLAALRERQFSKGAAAATNNNAAHDESDSDDDDDRSAQLQRENTSLREKNERDAQSLRQLEVMTASIARDVERLAPPRDRGEARDRLNQQQRAVYLQAQHDKLAQQHTALLAAAAARDSTFDDHSASPPATPRRRSGGRPAGSPRRRGRARQPSGDVLSHPATVRMLDALLEKEDRVASLRNTVAKQQVRLRELEPQQVEIAARALRHEVELVEAQETLKRTECEQVAHRMHALRSSCDELVAQAGLLRRKKLDASQGAADDGLLEKVHALLQLEQTELEAEIADTFQHNQRLAVLAAEQSQVRATEREQLARLTRRFQLLRSQTEGLRSLLSAYMTKRQGLRNVVFDQEERVNVIVAETSNLRAKSEALLATNAAATTLLRLLDMQQRNHDGDIDLGPVPPELTTKGGRDVTQLLGSVRTVEAAIVSAGGERAWEHMAEVLWRVRRQVGERLTPPEQVRLG